MEREDILNTIDEQEQWVARALSGVQESSLFPDPVSSDAAFLMRVRERIEKSRGAASYVPPFVPLKRVAAIASVCVVLLVAIIAGGRFTSPGSDQLLTQTEPRLHLRAGSAAEQTEAEADEMAEITGEPTESVVDSMADANIDPVELAQYLDVPDYVEEDVADTSEDLPLTDQLLALDTRTLEEVLTNLEDTEFF